MDDAPWQPVTEVGQTISAEVAAAPASALLVFDFDGTLARIVEHAQDARMDEEAAVQLARLGPRVAALAIITGRPVRTVLELGQLESRAGLEKLRVFGNYGVERWDAVSRRVDSPPQPSSLPGARAELVSLLESGPAQGMNPEGIWLEEKGLAIGVHYRLSPNPEETAKWLVPEVESIAARYGLNTEPGRLVIEIRSSRTTKGDALETLVTETGARIVIFAGDDLGDLPAFETCIRLRDKGLMSANVVAWSPEADERVGAQADICCQATAGLAAWLKDLADLLENPR